MVKNHFAAMLDILKADTDNARLFLADTLGFVHEKCIEEERKQGKEIYSWDDILRLTVEELQQTPAAN